MTPKLRLMRNAALLVLILPGAALAVAQADQSKITVPKDAVAQPAIVQQAPVATVGPVSRPGKFGALGVQDSISVALTVKECEALGGKVNDVETKSCASGKACYTADKDGVIKGLCIDNKVN